MSNLVPCKVCGNPVAQTAMTCPKCGAPLPSTPISTVNIHRISQFVGSGVRNGEVVVDGKGTGKTLNPGQSVSIVLNPGLHVFTIEFTSLGLTSKQTKKSNPLQIILSDMEVCHLEMKISPLSGIQLYRVR